MTLSSSQAERRRKTFAVLLSLLLIVANLSYLQTASAVTILPAMASREAADMADVLGVKSQLERLEQIKNGNSEPDVRETLALKSQIIQKVLTGFVEVRRASDHNIREINYSYYIMRKAARRQDLINECFSFANFAQLGTLYTLEPFLRLAKEFRRSAICTQSGSGTGILLAVANIAEQKIARTRETAPPQIMEGLVSGGPVEGIGLPLYVQRYLDSPAPDSVKTRRAEMYESWVKRFGVNPNDKMSLCPLNNDEPKTMFYLQTRLNLLWSLHTYILSMDQELLSLLQRVRGASFETEDDAAVAATAGAIAEPRCNYRWC